MSIGCSLFVCVFIISLVGLYVWMMTIIQYLICRNYCTMDYVVFLFGFPPM
jgi:hypothetical protein